MRLFVRLHMQVLVCLRLLDELVELLLVDLPCVRRILSFQSSLSVIVFDASSYLLSKLWYWLFALFYFIFLPTFYSWWWLAFLDWLLYLDFLGWPRKNLLVSNLRLLFFFLVLSLLDLLLFAVGNLNEVREAIVWVLLCLRSFVDRLWDDAAFLFLTFIGARMWVVLNNLSTWSV